MSPSAASARPRVGVFGLTGCAGDQLQILNCETELVALAEVLDIVDWVMVKGENDHHCRLDVAFVEGVVATERDLAALRELRARARTLVAIGTCAVWGGVPAMRNGLARDVLARELATPEVLTRAEGEAQPATRFVPFELKLPGCPIERSELLATVRALVAGTRPELPRVPVCWECKTRENLCQVVDFGEVCCGAMTRGGCGSRCPSHGVPCAGCRGPVEQPAYDAHVATFRGNGLTWTDIAHRMRVFSAPAWVSRGLEDETSHDRNR